MINTNTFQIPAGCKLIPNGTSLKGLVYYTWFDGEGGSKKLKDWAGPTRTDFNSIQGTHGCSLPRIVKKPQAKYYLCLPNDKAKVYRKDEDFEGYWSLGGDCWQESGGHNFKLNIFVPLTKWQAFCVRKQQKMS